jgi:hypothetical protein
VTITVSLSLEIIVLADALVLHSYANEPKRPRQNDRAKAGNGDTFSGGRGRFAGAGPLETVCAVPPEDTLRTRDRATLFTTSKNFGRRGE